MTETPADVTPDLTVGDVGQRMRVHPRTVVRWLDGGEFPDAYRLPGGAYRIPAHDVEAFIERRRITHEEER